MRDKSRWLLVALAAGGLALWLGLGRDDASSGASIGVGPSAAASGEAPPAELAAPDAATAPRDSAERRAGAWSVTVVDAAGAPLPRARLRATHGDEALEALGDARWEAPRAGAWTLRVDAEGLPPWERVVALVADRETRTRVVLGAPHRLSGTVRDSYGDPRLFHLVGFVPDGAPAPASARDWLALPHGRTDGSGRFSAELPRGRWRAFVGYSGRVLFEDERPVELGETGPFEVDIVVRAPSRLLIEVHEPPGAATTLPIGVSVYRRAEVLDRERPLPPQVRSDTLPDLDDPALDPETRAELELAVEADTRPLSAEERAAAEHRRQVVPDGWRMDRSAVLDAQRRLLLEFLPVGEELRFAVGRGREAFRVEGGAFVPDTPPLRVRIDLPAALPDGAALPAAPPAVGALVTPVTLPRAPLTVGAIWH